MPTHTQVTNLPHPFNTIDEYLEFVNGVYYNSQTTSATTTTYITPNTLATSSTWGITSANNKSWLSPNVYHNTHGPAIFSKNSIKWYIDGEQIFSTKVFCKAAKHTDESTMLWLLTYGESLPKTPDEYKYLHVDIIE